jgi:hypothetical protein
LEAKNLSTDKTKTHYILFQTKQCREGSELKILIKNREIVNVRSTDFLGVIIGSKLNWEVLVARTHSTVSHNLFIINILSKNISYECKNAALWFDLICHMESLYGDRERRHSLSCTAGSKQLES